MQHQTAGVDWLLDTSLSPHKFLAWDMGCGKTATCVRAWERIAHEGPALVLCLASARENWKREWLRFSSDPDFKPRIQIIDGGTANIRDHDADVVIINFDKLDNRQQRLSLHSGRRWGCIIADEAHYLKSPAAKRTQYVYGGGKNVGAAQPLTSRTDRVWLLSGTPIPNQPAEIWTHAYHLWPEALQYRGHTMELYEFELGYCHLVQGEHGYRIVGGKNLGELKQRLSPHLQRLKRKDVLDLPPLRIDTWPLSIGTTKVPDLPELTSRLIQRYGALAEVDQLDDAAIEAYLCCINTALSPLPTLRRETAILKAIATSLTLAEELADGGPKTVVFAHHREAIEALAKGLKVFNPAVVHGGVPAGHARDAQIDRFNADPKCRVFIGQLTAAGSSINLQAASQVVFVEASWTPGENSQAISRVYRHGQTQPVLVRFVYLKESIDEAVMRVNARKEHMINQVID